MITSRVLPEDEWPRLAGTELETVWPHLDPSSACIRVVEDGGRIVGHAVLFSAWHLESAWIAPEYRRGVRVGRRLLSGVRADLRARHVREVLMMAMGDVGRRLCQRFGRRALHLWCDHYSVETR